MAGARHEDVAGLDVAVNDSVLVGNLEDLEQLLRHGQDVQHPHRAADPLQPAGERLALEELHDEKRGAVFGRVVVEDGDGPWVVDLVRDVPFAEKPPSHLRVAGEARLKDLDRAAPAVAMGGLEDRAHPADFDQPIDVPFPVEGGADPTLGPRRSAGPIPFHEARIAADPARRQVNWE